MQSSPIFISPAPITLVQGSGHVLVDLDEEETKLITSQEFYDLNTEGDSVVDEVNDCEYDCDEEEEQWETEVVASGSQLETLYSERGMRDWLLYEAKLVEDRIKELYAGFDAEALKPYSTLICAPPPAPPSSNGPATTTAPPSATETSPPPAPQASIPTPNSTAITPSAPPETSPPTSLTDQILVKSTRELANLTKPMPQKLRDEIIRIRLLQNKLHRLKSHPYITKSTRMPHRKRKNMNGDLTFVEESESVPGCTCPLIPLIFQLTSQEELCTRAAYDVYTTMCTTMEIPTWIRYGGGDAKQTRLREWLVSPEKRVLVKPAEEGPALHGLVAVKALMTQRMVQGMTREPLHLVFHFQYSPTNLVEPCTSVMESDIQIVSYFARSCGGGKKLRLNYCNRLSMVLAKHLAESPSTRLAELQFIQRLIEDKFWMYYEECNDSAEQARLDPLITPLYISFSRDEIAFQLVPVDELVTHNEYSFIRREWFFKKDNVPYLYNPKVAITTQNNLTDKAVGPAVGVTQYFNLFSDIEQDTIDNHIRNLDKCFEIVLMQELAKVAIWPEKFNNLQIDLKCDGTIIPLRVRTAQEKEAEVLFSLIESNQYFPTSLVNSPDQQPSEQNNQQNNQQPGEQNIQQPGEQNNQQPGEQNNQQPGEQNIQQPTSGDSNASSPSSTSASSTPAEKEKTKKHKRKHSNSSKSQSPSKKQRTPRTHYTITCTRMQLIKIFQKQVNFIDLFSKESIRVKHCSEPIPLLTFLDELCSTVTDQAMLTCHRTLTDSAVQRTKFFFNLSYLWTDKHLAEKGACWAAFCRSSVPQPAWISEIVERRLVDTGLSKPGFFTSSAINVYHTGNTGLLPHYDDDTRFTPPIFSYQPFSGKRLSFGAITTRMTNCLMLVPLPRGCITVLEPNSFAYKSVKHCVRPQDMNGPSAALLMRHIPGDIMNKARNFSPSIAAQACDHKQHCNSGKSVKVLGNESQSTSK